MKINETFYSLQGEGIDSGLPTTFIRLAGCNLKCTWCDTKYALKDGVEKSIEYIVKEVEKYNCKRIYITGGEPLLQEDELKKLIKNLYNKSYKIRIATNGSIFPDLGEYPEYVNWDVDIKCPSSGEISKEADYWFQLGLPKRTEVKFVVQDEKDLNFVRLVLKDYRKSPINKWVSPVLGKGEGLGIEWSWLKRVAEFCKEENLRMGIQLHKIIWGNKKGV